MAVGVLGVILLAALQLHSGQATHLLRLPTCPPPSSDPGKEIFYPNAENCSNYYHCDNGNLVNLDCPPGLYFCSKQGVCAWPWDCTFEDCKIVNRHRINFLRADLTCPPPSSDPGKEIFYPNAENCSNYYHCDNGNLVNLDCPPGLYFCSKQGVCAWPWDCTFDDCKIINRHRINFLRDNPTCPPPSSEPGDDILYPNAQNCSNYFHCDNGNLVNVDCPPGLYFCSKQGVCAWPWDCKFEDCKMPSVRSQAKEEPACPIEDPNEHPNVTQLPNPANCSTYYKCSNGEPVLQDCPAGLFYCEAKEVCSWAWDCDFSNCKMDLKTSYKLGYTKISNDIILWSKKIIQRIKASK